MSCCFIELDFTTFVNSELVHLLLPVVTSLGKQQVSSGWLNCGISVRLFFSTYLRSVPERFSKKTQKQTIVHLELRKTAVFKSINQSN